jgi:large subunit ribosomal protein L19
MADEQQTQPEIEEQVANQPEPEQEAAVAAEIDEQPDVVVEPDTSATESRFPAFRAGDTLRLGVRIKEGEKTRTQYFEGIVLSIKGNTSENRTFTIRKIAAGGIAVERIFPLNSPSLLSLEVRRRGITRRAKVYFLRDIVGSTANVIKERKTIRTAAASKPVPTKKVSKKS